VVAVEPPVTEGESIMKDGTTPTIYDAAIAAHNNAVTDRKNAQNAARADHAKALQAAILELFKISVDVLPKDMQRDACGNYTRWPVRDSQGLQVGALYINPDRTGTISYERGTYYATLKTLAEFGDAIRQGAQLKPFALTKAERIARDNYRAYVTRNEYSVRIVLAALEGDSGAALGVTIGITHMLQVLRVLMHGGTQDIDGALLTRDGDVLELQNAQGIIRVTLGDGINPLIGLLKEWTLWRALHAEPEQDEAATEAA